MSRLQKKVVAVIGVFAVIMAGLAAIDIPIYLNNAQTTENTPILPTEAPIVTTSPKPMSTLMPTQPTPTSKPTTTPPSTPTPTPSPTPQPLDTHKFYFQATTNPINIPSANLKLYSDTTGQTPLTYVDWGIMHPSQTKKIGAIDPAVYIRNKGADYLYFRVSVTNLPSWASVVCHAQITTIGLFDNMDILNASTPLIRLQPDKKMPLELTLTLSPDAPENTAWIATLTVEGYASAVDPIIPAYMYYD